jgi:hypothetical protein
MSDKPVFRDQLLAVEPVAPDARDQLLQEIRNMLTLKLTWPHKAFLAVLAVFSLASSAVCAFLAITERDLPTLARVGLATGTLFGLSWLALFIVVLRRGSMDMLRDQRRMAQMVWVFTLLMVIFFVMVGMSSPDPTKGLLMIAQSLVFLISAAVYWLTICIQQSELSVKERLLRLELQLTELVDRRAR